MPEATNDMMIYKHRPLDVGINHSGFDIFMAE